MNARTPLLWTLLVALAAIRPAAAGEDEDPSEESAVEADDSRDARKAARKQRLEEKRKKRKWMILPLIAFDTDDGLGFGLRYEYQKLKPGYDPYVSSFVLHSYVTLRGYHHHRFNIDFPDMGRRHNVRFAAWFAFRAWLNDGYWGIGNGTAREREYTGTFEPDDPHRKRYRYRLIQPFAHLTLRVDMAGPLEAFTALMVQWSDVRTYEGSLLGEHQPLGFDGGLTAQLSGGFVVDSRQPERMPERGVFAELSGRVAPALPSSPGAYWGLFASFRGYVTVAPHFVLAGRVMAEWMAGDVPFYEMVRWGGSIPILGFGGWETLRGIPFGRWRGPHKSIANLELRFDVVRFGLFKETMLLQLVPFADVGAVWGAGDAAHAPAPDIPLHPAVGAGVHLMWADAFVGRIDLAVGPDAVLELDGSITQETAFGFYLVFDNTF